MLNIFKLKIKKIKQEFNIKHEFDNYLWQSRYNPSANREWFNSIYFYNKNNSNKNILLANIDIIVNKIIKNYFNMYNRFMEKRIKLPYVKKWKKRLKTNRFWISKGTVKHNNDKVTITLYIYNRQYNNLIKRFKKLKKKLILNYKINFLSPKYMYEINKYNYIISFFIKKNLKIVNFISSKRINNYKFNIKKYVGNIFKIYIKKCLRKEIFYLKYKQTILFNKLKFTNNLLLPLKILLTKIYNKNVEFKIITLKYYYLNSDIMSQIITTKLRRRKNRILRVLKSCLRNIKIINLRNLNIVRERNKIIGIYNETITKFLITNFNIDKKENNNIDIIKKFLNINYVNTNRNEKQDITIDNLRHKVLSGVRIQGSGRLTKRITAARSIYKLRYVGRLKNVDSSYKGLSTVMFRGNSKSNMQYTLLNSRTRIGAYGIKGWIAGY